MTTDERGHVATARSPSSPFPRSYDDLPSFAFLTNDNERERKAESQRPGTYGVVVTPHSFAELPEYAATLEGRRASQPWRQNSSLLSTPISVRRGRPPLQRARTDPNVIVLDRFEDAPTTATAASNPATSPPRRTSFPDVHQLTISTSPLPRDSSYRPDRAGGRDERLMAHFRQYIVRRLVQPLLDGSNPPFTSSSTRHVFELEAARFPPVRPNHGTSLSID